MAHIGDGIDDVACGEIMRRYRLDSKEEAINLALRKVAAERLPFVLPTAEPMTIEEALAMRGTGWGLDLNAMRSGCCRHEYSG